MDFMILGNSSNLNYSTILYQFLIKTSWYFYSIDSKEMKSVLFYYFPKNYVI